MQTRSRRFLLASLFTAATLLPSALLADQLKMKNGDVITGEVKKVEDNKVFIKPAYASEFSVDMAEVISIEAEKVFEMQLEDGSEVSAQFAGSTAAGEQALIVDGAQMNVGRLAVTQAAEPEPWYVRTSHVDLNMTWNNGNTDSENNLLFADTRMRLGEHRHLAELTIRRDKTNGIDTKKQDLFRYTYNWLFKEPWYLGANASYERDPIKDLDNRYTFGLSLGRDIIKDSNKFLTASLGAGYSREKFSGVADSGATGLWSLIYEHDFKGGDISFFHNHNINYNFYGDNNLIIKTNTGFRYDIIGSLYATVSYAYDHESEPAAGNENYDSTLAIGLGAEF